MTPDKYTLAESMFDVGDGHQLYVHDWGNRAAVKPIVFLHGGPGGSAKDAYKANFDPTKQRVIFFDQRGCGRSLPLGSLDYNTTDDLVEDIEKIANHLSLKTFIVTGGSWGSCLALAYSLAHPERVAALVLNGLFTGSQTEIDWLDSGKFQTFFPDVWAQYLAGTPPEYRAEPSKYHFARILGPDEAAAKQSAYAYEQLEGSLIRLDDRFTMESFDTYEPAGLRLETHYLTNRCFMPDNFILDNAARLKMPVWLVQGRYDMVCPPITAYQLHNAIANSQLIWTINGHKAEHEAATILQLLLQQIGED
jgi:proline iminopeptidase